MSNNGVASSTWDSSNSTAVISCHDEGSVTIYRTIMYASTVTESQFSSTHSVTLPFEEGVFYIRNKQLQNFMQIDNDDAPDHSTDGSIIEMWYFDAGHHQKWNIIHIYDGYYRIQPFKADLALAVQSSYANTGEVALIQEEYTGSNRQLWYLQSTRMVHL